MPEVIKNYPKWIKVDDKDIIVQSLDEEIEHLGEDAIQAQADVESPDDLIQSLKEALEAGQKVLEESLEAADKDKAVALEARDDGERQHIKEALGDIDLRSYQGDDGLTKLRALIVSKLNGDSSNNS